MKLGPAVAASAVLIAVGLAVWKRVKGQPAKYPVYILHNKKGMEVHITSVGAVIQKLFVPDKDGKADDVVLGYDKIHHYLRRKPCPYFGAIVGRCANRIAHARFSLHDVEYHLVANDGVNALHGGLRGLHRRVWEVDGTPAVQEAPSSQSVTLSYVSSDGEEGYPGTLQVRVRYELSKGSNELRVTMTAETDKDTPVNLAQHSYFNLAGHASGTVLDHSVQLTARHYTPVTPALIPTGEILAVEGTPFDFTVPHTIGKRVHDVPNGYDHNFVLFDLGPSARFIVKNSMASTLPRLAARVCEPTSGRTLDLLTTAPGLQLYTGGFLDGSVAGKGGHRYARFGGLCLETQAFPNSVNQPLFPSSVLAAGDTYKHEMLYKFGIAAST